MFVSLPVKASTPSARSEPLFTEAGTWRSIGEGWRPLHRGFHDSGCSIEWHDFDTEHDFDWSRSFHPGSVEICLNLAGHGEVRAGSRRLELASASSGFYVHGGSRLTGVRVAGERHQFVTVEFSLGFLSRHLSAGERGLHPHLRSLLNRSGRVAPAVSEPVRLTSGHQHLVASLRHPPVPAGAQRMWYQAKALEIAATLFYQPLPHEELFCQRQKRLNDERVRKVIAVLQEDLAEPPPLEEIGRRVGCSHFHLSRIFSDQMGCGIFQYLRELRMERAANLLRVGEMKITSIALEVGYASPSHFSTAFHETFGCCPGLYSLKTPAQVGRARRAGAGVRTVDTTAAPR